MIKKALITTSVFINLILPNAWAITPYHDPAGEVVRLSDESTRPFLFLGKPVRNVEHKEEHMHRIEEKYADSVDKFSSVRDCLLESEKEVVEPDLTKFDWDEIGGREDAAVCLFRVADSYKTPEEMKKWFKAQGGRVFNHHRRDGSTLIAASWPVDEQNDPKFSANFLHKIFLNVLAHGVSVGVKYDEGRKVVETSASFTFL